MIDIRELPKVDEERVDDLNIRLVMKHVAPLLGDRVIVEPCEGGRCMTEQRDYEIQFGTKTREEFLELRRVRENPAFLSPTQDQINFVFRKGTGPSSLIGTCPLYNIETVRVTPDLIVVRAYGGPTLAPRAIPRLAGIPEQSAFIFNFLLTNDLPLRNGKSLRIQRIMFDEKDNPAVDGEGSTYWSDLVAGLDLPTEQVIRVPDGQFAGRAIRAFTRA